MDRLGIVQKFQVSQNIQKSDYDCGKARVIQVK